MNLFQGLTNILYVLAALVIVGVIITVHELGHFIAGRLCGIAVVEFSIGFGPKIFGFRRKDTDYSLRAIPLGGFCKFVGEDEDNPDPRAMNNQPVWKRFITVAAGVVMNFLLAFVAAVILFAAYSGKVLPELAVVFEDTPAAVVGLQPGDVIVGVNGMAVSKDEDGVALVQGQVAAAQGSEISFEILRGEEELEFSLAPELVTLEDGSQRYQVGIQFGMGRYGLAESIPAAFAYMRQSSGMMLKALRDLVFRGEGANEMMGTVGIVSLVSQQVRQGWEMVFFFMFVISLNLGIINLLPLPALDGGRLVFLLVEGIRRKPIPPEKEAIVHALGFVLFMVLFVVLTYHDIARLIHG